MEEEKPPDWQDFEGNDYSTFDEFNKKIYRGEQGL